MPLGLPVQDGPEVSITTEPHPLCFVSFCCCCCILHFWGCVWARHFVFPHCTHLLKSTQIRLQRTVCRCVLSACFRTPRLSLGHPGSLTSVHDLKCMRTQTAPLFNVPRGRLGTTTTVVHPYPCDTFRAGNRTRVVAWGVQSVNHYTTGPAAHTIVCPECVLVAL